jgi:hypothetical protein
MSEPERAGGAQEEFQLPAEMIEAGIRVLWDSGALEPTDGVDQLLVQEIYFAMSRAAREWVKIHRGHQRAG